MSDNRKKWDAWREAEDARDRRKSVAELHSAGYECFKQSDLRRAASLFRQAAELAEAQGDVDGRCENLCWEGNCWKCLGELHRALERFLRAESLGGGDSATRFYIVNDLVEVARNLHLPRAEQEALLKKLAPYKGSEQIGGSKSMALYQEYQFLLQFGTLREALNRIQEAFASRVDNKAPSYNDSVYYRELVDCYRRNGLLAEAWKTLQDWRAHGSTKFADIKSEQFYQEALLLYDEERLDAVWDAIRRCQAEERYLGIHGQGMMTLQWILRIAQKSGRLGEARETLLLLFRWRHADSLYYRYCCFDWFADYYDELARRLENGETFGGSRYETPEIARKRAKRWRQRAERMQREMDGPT